MASALLGWAGAALRGPFQGAPISGVVELVEAAFGDAIEARRAAAKPPAPFRAPGARGMRKARSIRRRNAHSCAAFSAAQERDEAVAHFSREGGLGPPDLCWLRKARRAARAENARWRCGA